VTIVGVFAFENPNLLTIFAVLVLNTNFGVLAKQRIDSILSNDIL
jgi:hypothetical protein